MSTRCEKLQINARFMTTPSFLGHDMQDAAKPEYDRQFLQCWHYCIPRGIWPRQAPYGGVGWANY
jgi:hypothetical protein